MNRALKFILFITTLVVASGVANAQQYGIGRFERVQIIANDLEDAMRALYLREERQWPRSRSDVYVTRVLYRLHNQTANFQNQIERNFQNRERINLEYRRLLSTMRETEYTLNRLPRAGYLYRDLQLVSNLVHQMGRNLYAYGDRYRDDRNDRNDDDYDYDDDDYDEYDD